MAVPTATACPMPRKISTVDSVDRVACSNLSMSAARFAVSGTEISPLITLSMLASPMVAEATSSATMRLPRSLCRNASILAMPAASRFWASAFSAGASNTSMRNP